MTAGGPGSLFAVVDRAAFAAALGERLRESGLPAPLSATQRFAAAIAAVGPLELEDLYWLARLSYVTRHEQIAVFDRVFSAVFGSLDAVDAAAEQLAARGVVPPPSVQDQLHSLRAGHPGDETEEARGLPWATLPSIVGRADEDDGGSPIPDRIASPDPALAAKPFDLLDEDELRAIAAALEASFAHWPVRRSRRTHLGEAGTTIAHRATLRRARRTGGEVIELVRQRRSTRPRPVVAIVDVSGSMEPFARGYLHVMRALAVAGHAEVFAFATRLTRLTAALRHHSASDAIDRATDAVGDRFGGTRLATSLGELMHNPAWNAHLRGGVVVIVSDGADTDDPADLAARLARLSRLAHRLVWVNPRLAIDGYRPLVGGMAAALPYCDALLPGSSLAAIDEVVEAITRPERGRPRSGSAG